MTTSPQNLHADRGEHTAVTLGDLAALVAGIAVVLVMPRDQSYRLKRPSWLVWTGLGLPAALFLIAESTELIRLYSVMGRPREWANESLVRAGTLTVAILCSLLICKLFWRPAGISRS